MNPLTVTWPPILYTSYGFKNYKNWLKTGNLKNISAKRDEETMKKSYKTVNYKSFSPFSNFYIGTKNFSN